MTARVRAVHDEALRARIVQRRPLYYATGPDPGEDRSPHVRAASGLARFGRWLAVVQDDADFIGLIDDETGSVVPVALPRRGTGARQFDDERGNKDHKLDFEACVVVELDGVETLVAFGSGSSAARESVLLLANPSAAERPAGSAVAAARVVHVPGFYAALRSCVEFSGSELNLEGAARVGNAIRFFQRGNGVPRGGLVPIDATCDIEWAELAALLTGRARSAPLVRHVVEFDLGAVSGTRLTFTDATAVDEHRVLYLAAAEASPDARRDGPVMGTAIGVIEQSRNARANSGTTNDERTDPETVSARYALLVDERGMVARVKAEGIALAGSCDRVLVVLDADDPHQPSELCTVELSGPRWP